jgi:hypothetical protein
MFFLNDLHLQQVTESVVARLAMFGHWRHGHLDEDFLTDVANHLLVQLVVIFWQVEVISYAQEDGYHMEIWIVV